LLALLFDISSDRLAIRALGKDFLNIEHPDLHFRSLNIGAKGKNQQQRNHNPTGS
jgi:hypothetical protein